MSLWVRNSGEAQLGDFVPRGFDGGPSVVFSWQMDWWSPGPRKPVLTSSGLWQGSPEVWVLLELSTGVSIGGLADTAVSRELDILHCLSELPESLSKTPRRKLQDFFFFLLFIFLM